MEQITFSNLGNEVDLIAKCMSFRYLGISLKLVQKLFTKRNVSLTSAKCYSLHYHSMNTLENVKFMKEYCSPSIFSAIYNRNGGCDIVNCNVVLNAQLNEIHQEFGSSNEKRKVFLSRSKNDIHKLKLLYCQNTAANRIMILRCIKIHGKPC